MAKSYKKKRKKDSSCKKTPPPITRSVCQRPNLLREEGGGRAGGKANAEGERTTL